MDPFPSLIYIMISVNIVLGTIVVSSVSVEDFALQRVDNQNSA